MKTPSQKLKFPLTEKTQFYLKKSPDVNRVFNMVAEEDARTIQQVFDQGVDINFDVLEPNKLNIFNWCLTAHRVCNPHFLELMFKHHRSDIPTDGQGVFESACAYGDTRHIEVFMKYQKSLDCAWNVLEGMKHTLWRDNLANFHHLFLYKSLTDEETLELFEKATSSFYMCPKIIQYLVSGLGAQITKEKLVKCIETHFCETLSVLVRLYLRNGGEPFPITLDSIYKIISNTSDRIQKLEMLETVGFELEISLEELKQRQDLPKPSYSMYFSICM